MSGRSCSTLLLISRRKKPLRFMHHSNKNFSSAHISRIYQLEQMKMQNILSCTCPLLPMVPSQVPNNLNTTANQRHFHFDANTMARKQMDFCGIPSAYKLHRRKKYRKRSGRKSMRVKDGNQSYQSPVIHIGDGKRAEKGDHGAYPKVEKKISRLQQIENELDEMLRSYENEIGTFIDCKETSNKLSKSSNCTASELIQTEDIYQRCCVKMRQLIKGWSSITPFPKRFAEKLSKDQDRNSLPSYKAYHFISLLEDVRSRRSNLINDLLKTDQNERESVETSPGLIRWFTSKVAGSGADYRTNDNSKLLSDLTAHVSQDYTANTLHYSHILHSFRRWRDYIPQKEVAITMNSIISQMKINFKGGNPNVKPDVRIYHVLMSYNDGSTTLGDANMSVSVLKEMLDKTELEIEHGEDYLSCKPTFDTYTYAISSFRGIGSNAEVKLKAISIAEDILAVMENNLKPDKSLSHTNNVPESIEMKNIEESSVELGTNAFRPYNAMLSNLIAAGPMIPAKRDYVEKIDSLMERMMGADAYQFLLSDNEALIDTSQIDHLFLHDLIYAYSITAERDQLQRAKIILNKMELTRAAYLAEQGSEGISWSSQYPQAQSYHAVVIGLLHSVENSSYKSVPDSDAATRNDAIYATDLLDSMPKSGESGSLYNIMRVIRLWSKTKSKEAGRRGEEVMARLEMRLAAHGDNRLIASECAIHLLRCWSAAAAAGEAGAAKSASILLKRMHEHLAEEFSITDEKGRRNKGFLYSEVIRSCAETVVEADKAEALEVACEMFTKMQEDDIIPISPVPFILLLKCCQLIAPHSQDQALRFSRDIFKEACSSGVVTQHTLFVLKKVNYSLFEAYEKNPEHSMNLKNSKSEKSVPTLTS